MLIFLLVMLLLLLAAVCVFFRPSTGAFVSKKDMAGYSEKTPYTDGERFTYPDEWKTFAADDNITSSDKDPVPSSAVPVSSFCPDSRLSFSVTWLGHSSVLLKIGERYILTDPVFSERSSPFRRLGPKRFSKAPVRAEDLPYIDVLLLTHDHYDHLDMYTVKALSSKVGCFLVPLGVERHLIRRGIDRNRIKVLSWWEASELDGLTFCCCPSRHFSGRHLLDMNRTLFCSWMISSPYAKVFLSGDGSYGRHFREILSRYGSPDLAVMECGQYDPRWHPSHMYPEESVIASSDIGATLVLPVHWGAFCLAPHPWDDPITRFLKQAEKTGLKVITPLIGETADLLHPELYTTRWWETVR